VDIAEPSRAFLVRHRRAHARAAGCLWFVLAGWSLLFVAGASGVGLDVSGLLVPLAFAPFAVGLVVLAAGPWKAVGVLSVVAAAAYALLGVANLIRAADFERENPGADEISGGAVSFMFILIAVAVALWSLSALLIRRDRSHDIPER
jgi:hypothetical protein